MTYIIAKRTNDSILMASDSRLNFFNDKTINGVRCQEIFATADCIQKTFFILSANIGIQFQGIGYFPDNGECYPLGYFIEKIENLEFKDDFSTNSKLIYDFFVGISNVNDTGQYVKGIMTGFEKENAYITIFNTFNNDYQQQQLVLGNQVDSEGNGDLISNNTIEAIASIKQRINIKENQQWWNIGGPIDILKITMDSAEFVEINRNVFNGSQKELIYNFQNNLEKIQGKIFREPKILPYNF